MKSNIIDIEGWQYHATDKAVLFWTDETSREMAVMQETLDRWKRHEPDLGPPHMDGQGETKQ